MKSKKIFVLLVLLMFIALLGWCSYLYIKDKDDVKININYINFYVKNKLLKVFPKSQVDIQNTTLVWEKNKENFYLLFEGIVVNDKDITIEVPKIFLFSKAGLTFLFNSENIDEVSIISPNITLNENHVNQKNDDIKQIRELFTNMPFEMQIKINDLTIERSKIGRLKIDEFSIDKQKRYNLNTINIAIKSKNDMLVNLHAFEDHDHFISLAAEFSRVDAGLIGNLFSIIDNNPFANATKIGGNLSAKIDRENKIIDGQLSILEAQGRINYYSNPGQFSLDSASLNLKYNKDIINIDKLNMQIDQVNVQVDGQINIGGQTLLTLQIDKIPAKNSLCLYLPVSTKQDFKNWYCSNVVGGDISDIVIKLDVKISDLLSGKKFSGIELSANIKDIATKFHEDFKPVNNLSGNISIQDNNLKIIAEKAQFDNFIINNGSIELHNLGEGDLKLNIKGSATSNAYELFKLFKIEEIAKVDKEYISGEAKSEFHFDIHEVNQEIGFIANFKSKVDDLLISNDSYNFSIADYDIDLNFSSNHDIQFKSHGLMHGQQMQLNVSNQNREDKKLDYEFMGYLSPKNIKKFVELAEIDGYASVHLRSRYDDNLIIEGDVGLSDLELSYLGWQNTVEDYNSVSFIAEIKSDNEIILKKVRASGQDLDIELNGKIDSSISLDFSKFKLLNNDFKMQMQFNHNQNIININGDSIDLSNFGDLFKGNDKLHDIKVVVDVNKLIMKNNVVISDVYLNLNRIGGSYDGSKFIGLLPDGSDIVAEYSQIGLELYADNAGLFLRALNMTNTVKDGKLSFYLSSVAEDKTAYGMASLSNLYVVRAPILAKILALSSLQGIVSTLNNDGIYFHEFDIPFSYDNGAINIEESWLEGAELGISAIGNASLTDKTFKIKGQIIPAYALNKSIWKIPLLGKLLTGGKSRGIVAVDYEVRGDEHKNNVSVNLISVLTPNLLKRALGIFNHRTHTQSKLSE